MSIMVSGRKYVPAPEGMHQAVCVDVVDLGVVETNFGKKDMVRVVWELDVDMDDGRPFTISRRYAKSLHEKSALHKDLKAWRGQPFTPQELAGFDLENVVGAPCQILISHDEREGMTYANIQAITKAEKTHWLKPSGQYTRIKDRPEQGGNGGGHAPVGQDEESVPF